jgi:hypothetical protein
MENLSMNELYNWLNAQSGGLGTFSDFQQRSAQLVLEEENFAALFQLLSNMAGRFVSAYDGAPLPTAVAACALARLRDFLRRAAEARWRSAEEQLHLLNEIAGADLAREA